MLTIDHREHKIRDVYDGQEGVDFVVQELAVGDFMVAYEGAPDKTWLCERKSSLDLSASIKSGRFGRYKKLLKAFQSKLSARLFCKQVG